MGEEEDGGTGIETKGLGRRRVRAEKGRDRPGETEAPTPEIEANLLLKAGHRGPRPLGWLLGYILVLGPSATPRPPTLFPILSLLPTPLAQVYTPLLPPHLQPGPPGPSPRGEGPTPLPTPALPVPALAFSLSPPAQGYPGTQSPQSQAFRVPALGLPRPPGFVRPSGAPGAAAPASCGGLRRDHGNPARSPRRASRPPQRGREQQGQGEREGRRRTVNRRETADKDPRQREMKGSSAGESSSGWLWLRA